MSDLNRNLLWIAAFALLAGYAILRSLRARRASAARVEPEAAKVDATTQGDSQLVAVIAAAVAAASGLSPSQFRISGIAASGASRNPTFNTPPWGHADRFSWSGTYR